MIWIAQFPVALGASRRQSHNHISAAAVLTTGWGRAGQ